MKEKTGKLGINKEVTVALITAFSTILAAVISGIFLLYITNSSARSTADTAKNTTPAVSSTATTTTSFFPSNPSFVPTPTKTGSGAVSAGDTPAAGSTQALLQVFPATVNFSSCLPTEQRRIALNITNSSANQLSWSLTTSTAYSFSLLDHVGSQITTSGFSPTVTTSIASKQTQVIVISNIQGSGIIVVKSAQASSQTVKISCAMATTPSAEVSPASVAFDSCSSLNYRTFAFSIINNSNQALSWRLVNQSSLGSIAFATADSGQPGGQIQGKSTAMVLVYNIPGSGVLQLTDSTSSTYTINITCG